MPSVIPQVGYGEGCVVHTYPYKNIEVVLVFSMDLATLVQLKALQSNSDKNKG